MNWFPLDALKKYFEDGTLTEDTYILGLTNKDIPVVVYLLGDKFYADSGGVFKMGHEVKNIVKWQFIQLD